MAQDKKGNKPFGMASSGIEKMMKDHNRQTEALKAATASIQDNFPNMKAALDSSSKLEKAALGISSKFDEIAGINSPVMSHIKATEKATEPFRKQMEMVERAAKPFEGISKHFDMGITKMPKMFEGVSMPDMDFQTPQLPDFEHIEMPENPAHETNRKLDSLSEAVVIMAGHSGETNQILKVMDEGNKVDSEKNHRSNKWMIGLVVVTIIISGAAFLHSFLANDTKALTGAISALTETNTGLKDTLNTLGQRLEKQNQLLLENAVEIESLQKQLNRQNSSPKINPVPTAKNGNN